MAKGYSLHVGLDYVSAKHYKGKEWPLDVAVNDMNSMHLLAVKQGFESIVCLENEAATISAFKSEIRAIRDQVEKGDIFLLTYSGHGYQTEDLDGDEEEGDGMDENLCLFNGLFVDDKLNRLFCEFPEGVRILMVADCCHGGSIHKYGLETLVAPPPKKKQAEPKASVILLSGTADNQEAYEGDKNGRFTDVLVEIWDEGRFNGNYSAFQTAIIYRVLMKYGAQQSIVLNHSGSRNAEFGSQKPFTV